MSCLNEELDAVVLEIFNQLEQLCEAQEALEQMMRDGFLNMSRARYNLGVKRVSADQILEAELCASRTVTVAENGSGDDSGPEGETRRSSGSELESGGTSSDVALFSLHTAQASATHTASKEPGQTEPKFEDSFSEGLRKRNVKDSSIGSDKNNEQENAKIHEKKTVESSNKNLPKGKSHEGNGEDDPEEEVIKQKKETKPLNLFGILVPRELRTCQQKFEEAVALSVRIANLKHKLCTLHMQYKLLRKAKV